MEMRERERYFIFDIYFNKIYVRNLLCVCEDYWTMHFILKDKETRKNFVTRKFKKKTYIYIVSYEILFL